MDINLFTSRGDGNITGRIHASRGMVRYKPIFLERGRKPFENYSLSKSLGFDINLSASRGDGNVLLRQARLRSF